MYPLYMNNAAVSTKTGTLLLVLKNICQGHYKATKHAVMRFRVLDDFVT